jgi:hypothetical protein
MGMDEIVTGARWCFHKSKILTIEESNEYMQPQGNNEIDRMPELPPSKRAFDLL